MLYADMWRWRALHNDGDPIGDPPRLRKNTCRIGIWNDRFSRFILMLALALQLLWVHYDGARV